MQRQQNRDKPRSAVASLYISVGFLVRTLREQEGCEDHVCVCICTQSDGAACRYLSGTRSDKPTKPTLIRSMMKYTHPYWNLLWVFTDAAIIVHSDILYEWAKLSMLPLGVFAFEMPGSILKQWNIMWCKIGAMRTYADEGLPNTTLSLKLSPGLFLCWASRSIINYFLRGCQTLNGKCAGQQHTLIKQSLLLLQCSEIS